MINDKKELEFYSYEQNDGDNNFDTLSFSWVMELGEGNMLD